MGRTLPSITNAFLQEQQSLSRFRRALRQADQRALDELLAASRHHLAAAAYASHLLPFEIMLLAMLVEEHKHVLHLEIEIERLRHRLDRLELSEPDETPALPPPTLHETPTPYAAAEEIPERKRKWWAGG
ncbi:MAG TPA: hypothetical protein VLL77_11995 [Anaerolineales bacterium]|nr:hypothetical protein [Anaerolineales bacterium]